MDLEDIQYFFAVIEHRNLSNAARALRVSQPTLSRRMRALEHEFKSPLFLRAGRGMVATEAGDRLYEGVRGLERQLRVLKDEVTATLTDPIGEVAFGIPPSPRSLFGVPLLRRFAEAYPNVTVRIIEDTSGRLRDLIGHGELDIVVTNLNEPMDDVLAEPLGHEPMLLIGPPGARLSLRKEVPFEHLATLPLILTTRPNSLRLTVEAGLSGRDVRPNIRMEVDALPLMTDLVAAGLGYTVLPASGVRALLKTRVVTASPIAGFIITWLVATPKARKLGVAAQRFYEMLQRIGAEQVKQGIWQPVEDRLLAPARSARRPKSHLT